MMSSLEDARRFFALLARPGDVFELRALARVNGQQHTTSGYFDDVDKLVEAAITESGKHDGVYVTLNPVDPSLLFRAAKNRVRRAGSGDTTSDRDVRIRRSILVDVDPVRPAGISSSDEEHAAAIECAKLIRGDLSALRWPDPILADSGNGGHLIYAVELPVEDGGLVQRVLGALSKKYSTPKDAPGLRLKVDEKVFNPARISKIYGTLTRKGVNAPERPHRVAKILEAPDTLVEISRELLEAFAPAAAAGPSPSSPSSRVNGERHHAHSVERRAEFDLSSWIGQHLPDANERPWSEGRRWILPVCPFNDQHDRGEAYVTQLHSGSIAAGCQHESCFKSWRDLRTKFEPDAYERMNGNATNGAARVSHREPPPEVLFEDENYRAEIDAFADRDRDPSPRTSKTPARPVWKRAPEIVDEIWSRKDEPWIELRLADEVLVKVRPGGMAVVMGGSGSGKSSLVSNISIQHAREVGPTIPVSIELPADELGARIVGIQCDASWEEALRGAVRYEFMRDALDLPRMFVLERKNASLANLERCIDAARAEFPGQPILVIIDYAQIMKSAEREMRARVADVFERIDDVLRTKMVVGIVVSQMGRAGADAATSGEKIGAETASLGAESAAIERFATVTITLGMKKDPREDGSQPVELSIGKGRMSGGDRVIPMSYWGRSGKWRVEGPSKIASAVRAERDVENEEKKQQALEHQLLGAAQRSKVPLSREQLSDLARGRRQNKTLAIARLVNEGALVEVHRRAPKAKTWMVWTPDRVAEHNASRQPSDAEIRLVRDMDEPELPWRTSP